MQSRLNQCQGNPPALSKHPNNRNNLKDFQMKEKLYFAAEVAAVIVALALLQKNVMNVPVVGEYLPGYTPRA